MWFHIDLVVGVHQDLAGPPRHGRQFPNAAGQRVLVEKCLPWRLLEMSLSLCLGTGSSLHLYVQEEKTGPGATRSVPFCVSLRC